MSPTGSPRLGLVLRGLCYRFGEPRLHEKGFGNVVYEEVCVTATAMTLMSSAAW